MTYMCQVPPKAGPEGQLGNNWFSLLSTPVPGEYEIQNPPANPPSHLCTQHMPQMSMEPGLWPGVFWALEKRQWTKWSKSLTTESFLSSAGAGGGEGTIDQIKK